MKVTRYEPVSLFDTPDIPHTFSEMLDSFFADKSPATTGNAFSPAVNISEDKAGFHVEVALPGLKKDDVKVEIKNGRLTVSGERKMEKSDDGRRYHRVETHFGQFSRTFSLGRGIDMDNVNARFEDGILKIDLSKKEKAADKQIDIK